MDASILRLVVACAAVVAACAPDADRLRRGGNPASPPAGAADAGARDATDANTLDVQAVEPIKTPDHSGRDLAAGPELDAASGAMGGDAADLPGELSSPSTPADAGPDQLAPMPLPPAPPDMTPPLPPPVPATCEAFAADQVTGKTYNAATLRGPALGSGKVPAGFRRRAVEVVLSGGPPAFAITSAYLVTDGVPTFSYALLVLTTKHDLTGTGCISALEGLTAKDASGTTVDAFLPFARPPGTLSFNSTLMPGESGHVQRELYADEGADHDRIVRFEARVTVKSGGCARPGPFMPKCYAPVAGGNLIIGFQNDSDLPIEVYSFISAITLDAEGLPTQAVSLESYPPVYPSIRDIDIAPRAWRFFLYQSGGGLYFSSQSLRANAVVRVP